MLRAAVRVLMLALVTLTLVALVLAILFKSGLLEQPTLPTLALPALQTRPPSPTPSFLESPSPAPLLSPTAVPDIPLEIYSAPAFQVLYPRIWQVVPGVRPEEWTFGPPGDPYYGMRVRVEGQGYNAVILDAMINSELEAMRREGLMPEEIGLRRSADTADGQTLGRAAEFMVTIEGALCQMRVAALLSSFSTAYVLRLWALPEMFDSMTAGAYDRIVREFVPVYVAPPSDTPSPTTPPTVTPSLTPSPSPTPSPSLTLTPSITPSPSPTALPLGDTPYQGSGFTIPYPRGWEPTINLVDGTVTFLSPDPNLPVGVAVQPLGTGYDPASAPAALLDAYLAEVVRVSPGAIIGQERLDERPGDQSQGLSTTYAVPFEGWRLVYRVTILVSRAGDGAAYRILQWASEARYEAGYRELYRSVVAGFRPAPILTPQAES